MSDEDNQREERRVHRRGGLTSQGIEIEATAAEGGEHSETATTAGETLDVSQQGLLAKVDREIAVETLCIVRFIDPASQSRDYEARGFVRRSRTGPDGALIGIEFESPMDSVREPDQDQPMEVSGLEAAKILVVDDEPSIVELLHRFLSRRGCDVSTASNGEAALETLRQGRQEMVILDLKMPGMDGLEVLQRIREENLDVGRIWAISGYATDTEAREALRLGAADFINKPLDLKYLEWSMQLQQAAG